MLPENNHDYRFLSSAVARQAEAKAMHQHPSDMASHALPSLKASGCGICDWKMNFEGP